MTRRASAPGHARGRHASACRPLTSALLFLLLAGWGAPLAAEPGPSLRSLREMAGAGAPGLALERMDAAQPDAGEVPAAWARWERARIRILVEAGGLGRALERLAATPGQAPPDYRRWAATRSAELHLERGDAASARAVLRRLLWRRDTHADAGQRRDWRRLVVRSYLVGDRVDDAVTALRRFEQDFGDHTSTWVVLRTRVLLRAGLAAEAAEAADRLPADPADELHALALLARLRGERLAPAEAGRRARAAAGAEGTDPADAARFWFVVAEAARARGAAAERALATERSAARARALPAGDRLFRVDGDALWSAWLALGRDYANREQLLIGEDAAWFEAVEAALPEYPVRARSLLAVVALEGAAGARDRAHRALLERLGGDGPGLVVARRAYLHADRFAGLADVPEIVRYRLVDDALQRDDLALATRLMRELPEAPADVSPFAWRLLRARVLVLGGRREQGLRALKDLLADHPDLSGEALDRFLQVVFDLQGAQANEAALELLRILGRRDLPGQRRRELLYWRAESHEALDRPRRAATLYLRSATLLDGRGGDPWGQTARYHAARMLARAGFVGDARRIYEVLLRVTEDESRRSTLRQRLQKLGLREPAPADIPLNDAPR